MSELLNWSILSCGIKWFAKALQKKVSGLSCPVLEKDFDREDILIPFGGPAARVEAGKLHHQIYPAARYEMYINSYCAVALHLDMSGSLSYERRASSV